MSELNDESANNQTRQVKYVRSTKNICKKFYKKYFPPIFFSRKILFTINPFNILQVFEKNMNNFQ